MKKFILLFLICLSCDTTKVVSESTQTILAKGNIIDWQIIEIVDSGIKQKFFTFQFNNVSQDTTNQNYQKIGRIGFLYREDLEDLILKLDLYSLPSNSYIHDNGQAFHIYSDSEYIYLEDFNNSYFKMTKDKAIQFKIEIEKSVILLDYENTKF